MSFVLSIEGTDGSGKTTLIKEVQKYFKKRNIKTVVSREPGGVAISEAIRDILLSSEFGDMNDRTEALLFAAARRQHFVEKIEPLLASDRVLILDRFLDSSLAYQGCAREIGLEDVLRINDFALEGFRPQLTILLDLDVEIGLDRIAKDESREINKLDKESLDFYRKVREGYLEVASRYPRRIKIVDASRSPSEVVSQALQIVEERYIDVCEEDQRESS